MVCVCRAPLIRARLGVARKSPRPTIKTWASKVAVERRKSLFLANDTQITWIRTASQLLTLHEKGPKGYSAAVRTYAGKKDGPVSKTHADAIVKNVKSPPKPKKLTPKEWTLSKASPETYVTEAKSQYTYVGPFDPFLDKLAVAETKESPPKKGGVRMDLIPRKADASPTK